MVHNAKQKFLVASSLACIVMVGLLIGAIVAPNWISYSSRGDAPQYQGLFKSCTYGSCTANAFAANAQGSLGNLGCSQSGGELQDRMNVTAGTLLAAASIATIVIIFQLFHIFRAAKLTQATHMWLFWALILAFVSSLIGISVFGSTVNSWWNCGSDYCQPYKSTQGRCGVGYAYVFTVVACGTLLLAAVVVITFTKFPHIMYPTNDVVLLAVLLEVFSVCFIGIGVASPEWIVVILNYSSWGLFQTCTANSCDGYNLGTTLTTRTSCTVSGSSITSRFSASAALLIVSAVILAVLGVMFLLAYLRVATKLFLTNTKKRVTMFFLVLALVLQVIALIITTNVFDSNYYCGIGFCNSFTGFCRRGIGFGLCLASICLTALLITLHVFEFNQWCCFQERFASGRQSFSILKVLKGTKDDANKEPLSAPTDPTTAAARVNEPDHDLRLPAGQWDYDTVSGFYWSEERYLFYDPNTQQFYNPNTDTWTDRNVFENSAVPQVAAPVVSRSPERRSSPPGTSLTKEQVEMVRMTTPRRAGSSAAGASFRQ